MTVLLMLILLLLLRLVVLLMVHMLPLLRMLRVAHLHGQRMVAACPLGLLLLLLLRGLLRPIRSSHRFCSMWRRSRLLVRVHSALRDWSVGCRRCGGHACLPVRRSRLDVRGADGTIGDRVRVLRLTVRRRRVTQQNPLEDVVARLLSGRALIAGARTGPVS